MSRANQTLEEMALELSMLAASGAKHEERKHTTMKAKRDTGEMTFCGGCRMIMLSRWINETITEANKA